MPARGIALGPAPDVRDHRAARRRAIMPPPPAGLQPSDLFRLGLALPGVEESTSYGTPALKVKGKLMVRLLDDGRTVVIRSTWEAREARLAMDPEVFHVTDHYRGHPWVLMRLDEATESLAQAALEHAWSQTAPRSMAARRVGQGGVAG